MEQADPKMVFCMVCSKLFKLEEVKEDIKEDE